MPQRRAVMVKKYIKEVTDLFPDDIRIEETFSYLVRMFRMKNFVLPLDPKPTGSKIFMEKKKREDK